MDNMTIIAVASIVIAGLCTSFGCLGPALAEGKAVAGALTSLAQQPDASATITRTLFVGLATTSADDTPSGTASAVYRNLKDVPPALARTADDNWDDRFGMPNLSGDVFAL